MYTPHDFVTFGIIVFLEGVLSIDNALVLALIARTVEPKDQKKVLIYGLVGAFVFRSLAILLAGFFIAFRALKFVGGGYLLYLSFKHFFGKEEETANLETKRSSFWMTVLTVELTDMAFAVDSILAAVSMTNKMPIIIAGGCVGMVMMRGMAGLFIKLLDIRPRLETTAYLLVGLIGAKVVIEGLQIPGVDFHHADSPYFWIFWIVMLTFMAYGIIPPRTKSPVSFRDKF